MRGKTVFKLLVISLLSLCLMACSEHGQPKKSQKDEVSSSRVMSMSLSSDGEYALAINSNRRAYIWNLKDKTYRKVTVKPVNIYSAYFIPDTHDIMVQNDQTNEVYIEDIHGNVIKTFNPGFATYGEIITPDLKTYFAADEELNIFEMNTQTGHKTQRYVSWCGAKTKGNPYYEANPYKGPLPNGCLSAMGGLPNFKLVKSDSEVMATMGYKLYFWSIASAKWISVDGGMQGPMINAISPDKEYVATADSNGHGATYDFNNKKLKSFSWGGGKPFESSDIKNFINKYNIAGVTSINFIDKKHVLLTTSGVSAPFLWAELADPSQIKEDPIDGKMYHTIDAMKLIPLVKNPSGYLNGVLYPSTGSYLPVVATSPKTHLLVMAQANGNGIMVYKYDPENQTLKLIWSPTIEAK